MRIRLLLIPILILATLTACGDDDEGSTTGPTRVDVAGTLSNGSDLDNIASHWSSVGTSGPLLMISFLEDGTGRLNFGNDALFGSLSRRLNDFTWTSTAAGRITVTISVEESDPVVFSLLQVSGSVEDETMSGVIESEDGDVFNLQFTLGTGQPPCC